MTLSWMVVSLELSSSSIQLFSPFFFLEGERSCKYQLFHLKIIFYFTIPFEEEAATLWDNLTFFSSFVCCSAIHSCKGSRSCLLRTRAINFYQQNTLKYCCFLKLVKRLCSKPFTYANFSSWRSFLNGATPIFTKMKTKSGCVRPL